MKKTTLCISLILTLNSYATSYTNQLATILKIASADIYNLKTLVEVPARGSTPALTTIKFSYDVEEYNPVYGLDVLTYNCLATAATGVINADLVNCKLDEGTLQDEY